MCKVCVCVRCKVGVSASERRADSDSADSSYLLDKDVKFRSANIILY